MEHFREIHESPATAHASDNIAQAAAMMSQPGSQTSYMEMMAARGNTVGAILPSLSIGVENSAVGHEAPLPKIDITVPNIATYQFYDEQHVAMRKYDGSSYGTGLEEGNWE